MSIALLLQAVRDELRAGMTFQADPKQFVGIQPGGRPPAWMSDFYIAVDEANIAASDRTHLKEIYTIAVTITVHVRGVRSDQTGDQIYIENLNSLENLERAVIRLIHASQSVRARALTLGQIPNTSRGDIFQLPLYYEGRGATAAFDAAEWLGSVEPGTRQLMVRVLRFSGATRVQALDVIH